MHRNLAKILGTVSLAGLLVLALSPTLSEPGRKYFEYGVLNFSGKLHPVFRDENQRAKFMLKMTGELIAPIPNYCIDLLHRRLGKSPLSHGFHATPAVTTRTAEPIATVNTWNGESYENLLRLTQDNVQNPGNPTPGEFIEGEGCHEALASCGNCHLPKINNCNYKVSYLDGKATKTITGQVTRRGANTLTINAGDGDMTIAAKAIVKSDWLDGGDPIETWWDFEAFGARGRTATKMLDIVHEHKVACTNCHLKHGDFRLTAAGKAFQKDETIIKNVPLKELLD